MLGEQHFVMWWVPVGHRPTLDEALERLALRQRQGDSEMAFGWSWLGNARLWQARQCRPAAE